MCVCVCVCVCSAVQATDKAASGYTYVCLDDSFSLYTDVLTGRYSGGQPSGRQTGQLAETQGLPVPIPSSAASSPAYWRSATTAANAAVEVLTRANCCVTSRVRGPALRQAEDVLSGALEASLPTGLCGLIDAARAAQGASVADAGAAATAALRAMAAMSASPPPGVVCAPGQPGPSSSGASDLLPLARTLSSRHLGDGKDKGMTHTNIMPTTRKCKLP